MAGLPSDYKNKNNGKQNKQNKQNSKRQFSFRNLKRDKSQDTGDKDQINQSQSLNLDSSGFLIWRSAPGHPLKCLKYSGLPVQSEA